ncbi:MAG: lipid-A-disaccharide synthase [Pseudomonadota bacterium]
MKIGIVAGEKSGDYLGSELIQAIRSRYPDSEFVGLCGPLMQEQGAISLAEMDKISIMGLDGLLTGLPEIIRIRRLLYKHFTNDPPDVFIGIDVPDFNLGLEKKLKKAGIKTVHYVSPTVWAWRGGRIKKIRAAVDLMLTLFPFEETYYQKQQVPVRYVGHPLAGQVMNWSVEPEFRNSLAAEDETLIAVLPGSRMSEVSRLAPEMIEASQRLASTRPNLRFAIPAANAKIQSYLVDELKLDQNLVKIVEGRSRDLLAVSDLAILASGTAALEAALFAKPMVVMYRMSWLTIAIFKRTLTVSHYSMPNHLTDPPAVPELVQKAANADRLLLEVEKLLDDEAYFTSMQNALTDIAPMLSLDSGALACEAIEELLAEHREA